MKPTYQTKKLTTIVRELPSDLDTPISVYLKLRGKTPSFLLESVEGGERIARYSFIGVEPRAQYILSGSTVRIIEGRKSRSIDLSQQDENADPTQFLQQEMARYQLLGVQAGAEAALRGLPRFIGGLVGYMSYESVRHFEPTLKKVSHSHPLPDAHYLLADTIVAFDHARRTLYVIANALEGEEEAANQKIERIIQKIQKPLPKTRPVQVSPSEITPNMRPEEYMAMVEAAKEHIYAGDIFQVVLSQRFERKSTVDAFEVYRAVRRLNPSPYMFFFDFGQVNGQPRSSSGQPRSSSGQHFHLVGASPEIFVRLEGRKATLRPIAGTRRRGASPEADAALEAELLADPKERAEHVMLVDLGRNDLGRVCEYGSVNVSEFSTIERYSHVMHIVSHVEGTLKPGLTAFDLVRAAFPAGTVSGAPKVRAMEIIAGLEKDGRGPYAGTIGYFGFDGAMDTCLAIRTLVAHGETFSVQAGAGIVADSDPAAEYQETINKASATLKAIDMAEAQYLPK